jgi:Icc protein
MSPATEPLRILHVTDLHLRAAEDGELYGVRTHATFRAVMERALRDAAWQPSAVLATGDLAEDPSREVYERFRAALEPLGLPVLCIPGNHDDPAVMAQTLDSGNFSLGGSRSIGHWRFVMLDTFLRNDAAGALSDGELARLERELAVARDQWVLVAVHHQPVAIGSAWLDGVGLRNGPALLSILGRHRQARAVVWGHVHQAFEGRHGPLRLLSTPSTCAQFTPQTARCVMDTRPPGFRRLDLGPGGEVQTTVHWLEDWTLSRRPPDSRAPFGPADPG